MPGLRALAAYIPLVTITPENNPGAYLSGTVASMPLADAQALAAQQHNPYPAANTPVQQPTNPTPPPVVVDLDLDQIPDQTYTPQTFRLGGNVYTLVLTDDHLLAELSSMGLGGEMEVDEMHETFFARTYHSAVDASGRDITDGYKVMFDALFGRDSTGKANLSLTKRSQLIDAAIETWGNQLSDTSMRPGRRNNRQDRRSKANRR
jgi:hypothetical protein